MLLLPLSLILCKNQRLFILLLLLLAHNLRNLVQLIEETVTGSSIGTMQESRVVLVQGCPIVSGSMNSQSLEVVSILVAQGAKCCVVSH
jgi:hypothetical protein